MKLIDETGNKYKFLTVIKRSQSKDSRAIWECLCICGKIIEVVGKELRKNKNLNCGCNPFGGSPVNEVGNTYGKLKVIEKGKSTYYGIFWICRCDCGKITEVLGTSLRNGKAVACGCNRGFNTGPHAKVQNKVLKAHFISYKTSKRANQLGFDLSYLEFENICRKNCYYCNSTPQPKKYLTYRPKSRLGDRYSYDNLNGIDRLDNSKGYIEGNCIPACGKCNMMKRDHTEEQFLEHISRIYKNNLNRG